MQYLIVDSSASKNDPKWTIVALENFSTPTGVVESEVKSVIISLIGVCFRPIICNGVEFLVDVFIKHN